MKENKSAFILKICVQILCLEMPVYVAFDEKMSRPINRMRPVHPGEILREDYLAPLGMSANALANALGVPATRIHEILKERRSVTADTAQRLARYFGGDAASWLNLQAIYDLKTLATQEEIMHTVTPRALELSA